MDTGLFASVLLVVGLVGSASAQVRAHKLNSELGVSTEEDVHAFRVSSEGYMVFARTSNGVGHTLLSAPVDGSAAPVQLGDHVLVFTLTPDESRVVFTGPSHVLYVAWVDGSRPAELLAAHGTRGQPQGLVVSPDGQRAVFLMVDSDEVTYEYFGVLLSADLDGSGWRRIDAVGTDPSVRSFQVSPDGSLVVYATGSVLGDIFVVPTDGSQPPLRIGGGDTAFLRFTRDGQRILFSDPGLSDRGLYSVPTSGGAPVRLNPGTSLLAGPPYDAPLFEPAQPVVSGDFVYFLANGPAGIARLYRAPTDGSGPALRLDAPYTPFLGAGVSAFRLLPGDTHLVYAATVTSGLGDQLFRAPTDGSQAVVELSGAFFSGGGIARGSVASGFLPSPDGTRVAFVADRATDEFFEAWSVPSDGSAAPVRLVPGLPATSDVQPELAFTPDGRGVLLRIREASLARTELHLAASSGAGGSARLCDELAPGGEAVDVVLGPGGQRAFYRADRERDEAFELFGVRLASAGAPVRLSEPLDYRTTGEVQDFFLAPDGGHAVYHAQLGDDSILGLHARELRGPGREHDLTDSVPVVRSVLGFSSEGRIVYTTMDRAPLSVKGVYSAPLDGSLAPLLLTDAEVSLTSPDGRWILFVGSGTLRSARTDGSSGEIVLASLGGQGGEVSAVPGSVHVLFTTGDLTQPVELYSTRLDGSSVPRRINAPLAAGHEVTSGSLRYSPDGQAVLYLAGDRLTGQLGLYLASTDGSFAARRLSAPSSARVNFHGFFFTPDGTRVVYAADSGASGAVELFVVPSDGSALPVQLSRPASNGSVSWATTQVSSTHAYFRGGGISGPPGQVFRVPLDASAPPERLTTASGVLALALTPDGSRLVFSFGGTNDTRLYSVKVDGSSGALLSTGLTSDERVFSFQLSPDGSGVIYNQRSVGARRSVLMYAPVEGGRAPRLLTPGIPDFRSIRKYLISPDGSRVLYLVNQGPESRHELFESFLAPPHRTR